MKWLSIQIKYSYYRSYDTHERLDCGTVWERPSPKYVWQNIPVNVDTTDILFYPNNYKQELGLMWDDPPAIFKYASLTLWR